jgi:hypothetical protein
MIKIHSLQQQRPHCATRDVARIMLKTMAVFAITARALGLPEWLDLSRHSEGRYFHNELFQAGVRATEAQRRRRERYQR